MLGLVSIIIPFYKKKKFIKNTIDSVANQTYRNYEVIFVYDDPNKEDFIPPTINHSTPDENIDQKLNLTLNKGQAREVNVAMTNTFGFGGHNASIVIKKYKE